MKKFTLFFSSSLNSLTLLKSLFVKRLKKHCYNQFVATKFEFEFEFVLSKADMSIVKISNYRQFTGKAFPSKSIISCI